MFCDAIAKTSPLGHLLSLADAVDRGAADRADTAGGWFSILQGHLFGVLDRLLCPALETVSLCHLLSPPLSLRLHSSDAKCQAAANNLSRH